MENIRKQIRVVEAKGSHYEIGFTIGKETGKQINRILKDTGYINDPDPKLAEKYREYMAYVDQYPYIIDELQGMADGAQTDFDKIAKLNIVELNKEVPHVDNCSSFIVKNEKEFIIAHNEDGHEGDDIFLLRAVYPSGIETFSFCYYGSLPGFSINLNSAGLITICNALHANDKQVGEPKRIFARRLVECRSIDEAIEIIGTSRRAQGQNFTFSRAGKIMGVETSATNFCVREVSGNYYHCNNYIFPEMKKNDAHNGTGEGYLRTIEGKKVFRSLTDLGDVRKLLSSHKNRPYCFCAHGSEEGDQLKTLGSVYFDCIRKKIWVACGYACRSELREMSFNHEW